MSKTVIISGIGGQDGSYLAKKLLNLNYKVFGIIRNSKKKQFKNLKILKIEKKIHYLKSDISNHKKISSFIKKIKPNMFFNFAGISSLDNSNENLLLTDRINNTAVLNILESIKNFSNKTHFFQASSSELFKKSKNKINENSKFSPKSPYAISKLSIYYYINLYRSNYKIFAVNGFLFNHESPLRADKFLTKKITKGLVNYKFNEKKFRTLSVGNIYTIKDWGDAEEYVGIIYKTLMLKKPDDYIIASGNKLSVKNFINMTAKQLKINIKWINKKTYNEKAIDTSNRKTIIKVKKNLFRKNDSNILIGNIKKIKTLLKWKPPINIDPLIKKMIQFEINNVKNKNL
jgi:GDPmannose 4,6-dehydratase